MSTRISEERYNSIKKLAKRDASLLMLEGLSPEEKEQKAKSQVAALKLYNNDEISLYIAYVLINDDNFVNVYREKKKNVKELANYYQVSQNVVTTRIFAEQIFCDYSLKEKSLEDSSREAANDENGVKTLNAITRISQLLELNLYQEELLNKQERDLGNKDDEISALEARIKDKDVRIESLRFEVSEKEDIIKKQQEKIKSMEQQIEEYKAQISKYLSYKANYERIIEFLDKNLSQNDKKTIK